MDLTLTRVALRDTYTIGRLEVNGSRYCDTLEDRVRDLAREAKVPGRTAIPAGRYRVAYNYSPKFRRKMPRLLAVPHFDGILIHAGNDPEDTAGCILVGRNRAVGRVLDSVVTFEPLRQRIADASARGEQIWITITNPAGR